MGAEHSWQNLDSLAQKLLEGLGITGADLE
jgi:hypothetical protein